MTSSMNPPDSSRYIITWKGKLTLMSKQNQKCTDDLHLSSENTTIGNSINDYPEEDEKHSQH